MAVADDYRPGTGLEFPEWPKVPRLAVLQEVPLRVDDVLRLRVGRLDAGVDGQVPRAVLGDAARDFRLLVAGLALLVVQAAPLVPLRAAFFVVRRRIARGLGPLGRLPAVGLHVLSRPC